MFKMNNFYTSPLQVQPIQVVKLWQNPEGTKCTRVTVALINGYRRATIGKFFRIVDESEAKRLDFPHNQWIPEKKGKHLCLAPYEIEGLNSKLKQILKSLEEAEHFSNECERRAAASGPGRADQGAAFFPASAPFGKCAASAGKKRGRKPKDSAQAIAQEECDGGAKRQECAFATFDKPE